MKSILLTEQQKKIIQDKIPARFIDYWHFGRIPEYSTDPVPYWKLFLKKEMSLTELTDILIPSNPFNF